MEKPILSQLSDNSDIIVSKKDSGVDVKWTSSENIITKLFGREMGFGQSRLNNHFIKKSHTTSLPGNDVYHSRALYQNIVPNVTVTNVKLLEASEYVRKFSPDGRHFITLADSLNQVYIYLYKGSGKGSAYLSKMSKIDLTKAFNPLGLVPHCVEYGTRNLVTKAIRSNIFKEFFSIKFKIKIPHEHHTISRDLCLFTEDSKFVIFCSYGPSILADDDDIDEAIQQAFEDSLNGPAYLRDYQMYAVNLKNGKTTGTIKFNNDRLALSLKNGVYMLNNLVTVLSIQNQIIHIYWLNENGEFERILEISQFCTSIEDTLFEDSEGTQVRLQSPSCSLSQDPESGVKRAIVYESFKQKVSTFVFTYMWKDIPDLGGKYEDDEEMCEQMFYEHFHYIEQMRMWKVQMIDDNNLMVKMVMEEELFHIPQEFNNTSLIVIYDIVKAEIVEVLENSHEDIVTLYSKHFDQLQNMERFPGGRFCTNATNNYYSKLAYERCINSLHESTRVKQVAGQLPIPAQNFTTSPYLDHALFLFDDIAISAMERPRTLTRNHLRFCSRDSSQLKFTLEKSKPAHRPRPASDDPEIVYPPDSNYVAFHPTDPFALSVQRVDNRYYYNLHFRLDIDSISEN